MPDTVPWSSYEHDIREMRERAVLAEARVSELEAAIGDLFQVVTATPFAEHHAFANERVRALHDAWKGKGA